MTHIPKKVIFVVVAGLLCFAKAGALLASEPSERASGSAALIRSEFDDRDKARRFELQQTAGSGTLEICGDMCDFFVWKNARNMAEVWDFVLIYEYERGIGSQLEGVTETFKPRAREALAPVLQRYRQLCAAERGEEKLLSCVMLKLAKRNHLTVGFVNYDEGNRCIAWGDLNDRTKMSEYHCSQAQKESGRVKGPGSISCQH